MTQRLSLYSYLFAWGCLPSVATGEVRTFQRLDPGAVDDDGRPLARITSAYVTRNARGVRRLSRNSRKMSISVSGSFVIGWRIDDLHAARDGG